MARGLSHPMQWKTLHALQPHRPIHAQTHSCVLSSAGYLCLEPVCRHTTRNHLPALTHSNEAQRRHRLVCVSLICQRCVSGAVGAHAFKACDSSPTWWMLHALRTRSLPPSPVCQLRKAFWGLTKEFYTFPRMNGIWPASQAQYQRVKSIGWIMWCHTMTDPIMNDAVTPGSVL